ncbi:MAG: DUF4202 domain-containing protein [Polyangiaceae bacterium]|nr:DUF4202 domain-containing protein [Polyangiaceae bacterium]
MSDDDRFKLAADRFGLAHREDPKGEAATYHETLASWVDRLDPNASEPLRLAARCQHLRRHETPRSAFPEGPVGYKRWRSEAARKHAADAATVLREVGYGDDVIGRVGDLLVKKGFRSDPEGQLLEDAVCLTFLELELERFADKYSDDKVVDILKKTWVKMSARGHEAAVKLSRGLPLRLTSLIAKATGS